MRVYSHDAATFPLPSGHRFPLAKYRLLRERLLADGTVTPADVTFPDPCPWRALALVHDRGLLDRIRTGALDDRQRRALGLPWSPQLVERARRSVAGTLAAAHDALEHGVGLNLGGGTHHAGHAFAHGYCLFNDVAVATARLRAETAARRVLVVDCDVHQGDGTADLMTPDPAAFTLSLHGARNYPFKRIASDLDVDLATGTGDADYLVALEGALDTALHRLPAPDLAFYLAGADPWAGDRLGRLALSKDGLAARDALVLDRLGSEGVAVCVVLAGGYAPDVRDTVDINAATARAVKARVSRPAACARAAGAGRSGGPPRAP